MPPTIIRASDQNRAIQQAAFNFDDMAAQANRYLEKVKVEAAQIVVKAQQEAEQLKQRAVVEGRQTGQQNIEATVQRQLAQQLTTLMPALREAVTQIQHAKQAWLTHWEKTAVHVATAIAGRIVRRAIQQDPQITLNLVQEALGLATGMTQLKLQLAPQDHQALGGQVAALIKQMSILGSVEVVANAAITPGGCRLETRFGTIDQQIETQLARIEEELT